MTPYRIVFITVPTGKKVREITEAVLRARLAACVTTIPLVQSAYWWKGKLEHAHETLLMVKTVKGHLPRLINKIRSLHP